MIRMSSFRKAGVFLTAAALVAAAVTFAAPQADGATGTYVRFVNKVTRELEQSTTILEGESIQIVSVLPAQKTHKYVDPFFRTVTEEYKKLKIFSASEDNLTLNRMPFAGDTASGAPAPTDSMALTIRPQFQVFVTNSSSGKLSYEVEDPSTLTGTKTMTSSLTAKIVPDGTNTEPYPISITETGTLKFSSNVDQQPDGSINFTTAKAKGGLAEFNGGDVTYHSGTKGNLTVVVKNMRADGSGKDLWLQLSSNITADILKSGAEFSLEFALDTINDLQMQIISEPKALDQIAKDIANNSFFSNFVTLSGDDTQNSVTQGFQLRHIEKRYNALDFKIQWECKAADYTGAPFWKLEGSDGDEFHTFSFLSNRPMEDVWLDLTATVSHGASAPTRATIRILVRGSGVLPSFTPQYSYQGVFNPNMPGNTTDAAVELRPTEWPKDLDVNDGSTEGFPSAYPYKFSGTLNFGTGLQSASYVTFEVKSGNDADVEIYLNNNLTTRYQNGSRIGNPNPGGSSGNPVPVTFRASKPGTVTVSVTYYNSQGGVFNKSPESHLIAISDTRPSSDARMRSIAIVGEPDATASTELMQRFQNVYPNGRIDYGFDMDQFDYPLTLPWIVDSITLQPSFFHTSTRNGPIRLTYYDRDGNRVVKEMADGEVSPPIPLTVGREQKISIVGVAEDGTNAPVYNFNVTRLGKSDNAFLQSLTFTTREDGVEQIAAQLGPVDLTMQFNFSLSLPYAYRGTQKAEISATTDDSWAQKPVIDPVSGGLLNQLRQFFNTGSAKVDLIYQKDAVTGEITNRNVFTVTVTSESGVPIVYTIAVTIEDPSENNELSSLNVYRDKEKDPLKFDNGQVFTKEGRDLYLTIPYSTKELRLELLPDDEKAQKVRVTWPAIYGGEKMANYGKKGTALNLTAKVPVSVTAKPEEMEFVILVEVLAESEQWTGETSAPYVIHVTRSAPDTNSLLESLSVTDAKDGKAVGSFSFNRLKREYSFTVPFQTAEVFVYPVPQSPLAAVTVNGTAVSGESTGKRVALTAGGTTRVVIEVTPEGGPLYQGVYTLDITRAAPGTDARLLSLTVNGGENMKPEQFVPSRTSYSVEIPEGTRNFTITAVPVDGNATLTVNGSATANGAPSAPIVTTQADTRIPIVVTAEDGRTTKTYIVTIRDYNFVKKSSNAALSSLGNYYADLEPQFKPNILEYELYLKPETMYVDLTPETESGRAGVEVYAGSKKLTAYNGKFSTSILADKTNFTIRVTAEDGTQREYTIAVYRNDKKKQGDFKPITSAMVDWTEDPIVIDITQYAVISSTVFNTLKSDYPEKSILFQGLDYSFKIKGGDISGLVPHTTTYDLNFSFTSPNQDKIEDALWEINAYDAEPVYFHFNNHGNLPGRMVLTVNLGREYANQKLYWNYYNEERDRIDYYGYTTASAKGTFSVPLTHFSDYLATTSKLDKAMDMAGTVQKELEDGYKGGSGGGSITPPKKDNPQTGVLPVK